MRRWVGAVVVAGSLFAAANASAQEKGRVGVTAGSPGLGVVWHASDNIAVRAELTFELAWRDAESEPLIPLGSIPNNSASSADSRSIGTAVSALFYLARWDSLRTYVAPRFQYARGTTTFSDVSRGQEDNTNSTYGLSGSLGATYVLGDRFAIFGEVGLQFNRQKSTTRYSNATSEAANKTLGTRTGVGVVFDF